MSFSKAFEKAGMKPTESQETPKIEIDPEKVPMMYRAQVSDRCSLQFANDNQDLQDWAKQWVNSKSENNPKPLYQYKEPKLGLDGSIYRIKIQLPFRLSSNCGQDNILRPIMGKNGIPFLSGSSVKGLFSRACNEQQRMLYCGEKNEQDNSSSPSKKGFRFHGAYPIGDWAGIRKLKVRKPGEMIMETRYRMLDVIHPQQPRQLGDPSAKNSASVYTMVSLYQPTMVFEFSSADPKNTDWQEVENIFWKAIALGIGGKTSTGYGLGGYNEQRSVTISNSKINVPLIGQGVSPTLRSDEPEFRANLFKASLRGHIQRLLAGVVFNADDIRNEIARLFGSSEKVGVLKIFWEQQKDVVYDDFGYTKTFKTEGILHLDADLGEDVDFIKQVLKFAFVMGGFGKSWRRASHELFLETYKKFEIGCHWKLDTTDLKNLKWLEIKSVEDLQQFLKNLYDSLCSSKCASKPLGYQSWRESWHPDRLTVFAKVSGESHIIHLFHDDTFKTTLAIGGRTPHREHPKKTKPPECFSHVWHRMLPIGDGQYLEIVTVFHSDRTKWKHKDEGDQLENFLAALAEKGLKYVWGNQNPLQPSPQISTSNIRTSKHQPSYSDKPILKPKPPQK